MTDEDQLWAANAQEAPNDEGNARRFVRMFGDDLKFHAGMWRRWNGKVWSTDDASAHALKAAAKVAEAISNEAAYVGGDATARMKWAITTGNVNKMEAMLKLAQRKLAVSPEQWDANEWLLNFQNGTLDLRTGLREHCKDDLITKMIDNDFSADATDKVWDKFKQGLGVHWEFVLRYLGYSLTGCTREEVALILHGRAGTGKTTLIETMLKAMGPYAEVIAYSTLTNSDVTHGRPDLARLQGVRFLACDESIKNGRVVDAVFKPLTSGGVMPVRQLYQPTFNLKAQCKLLFAVNNMPALDSGDTGLWRRVLKYSLTTLYDQSDVKEYLTSSKTAQQAFMADLFQRCQDWQHNGLQVPPEIMTATAEYKDSEDETHGWVLECLEFEPDAFEISKELMDNCKDWLAMQGFTFLASDARGFHDFWTNNISSALRSNGAVAGKDRETRAKRGWRGVRLLWVGGNDFLPRHTPCPATRRPGQGVLNPGQGGPTKDKSQISVLAETGTGAGQGADRGVSPTFEHDFSIGDRGDRGYEESSHNARKTCDISHIEDAHIEQFATPCPPVPDDDWIDGVLADMQEQEQQRARMKESDSFTLPAAITKMFAEHDEQ